MKYFKDIARLNKKIYVFLKDKLYIINKLCFELIYLWFIVQKLESGIKTRAN